MPLRLAFLDVTHIEQISILQAENLLTVDKVQGAVRFGLCEKPVFFTGALRAKGS